ncbi:hypothetical protein EYF80_007110 [Liparis tanakae]|uniref:Uncharacterized protein n=1 Tax=Liparis tanakae TaxID=230148 RepID=A0A4Z2IZ69_9TELE|nr:hypothetical protein EYF80_007110 [Liparis tanakae]
MSVEALIAKWDKSPRSKGQEKQIVTGGIESSVRLQSLRGRGSYSLAATKNMSLPKSNRTRELTKTSRRAMSLGVFALLGL